MTEAEARQQIRSIISRLPGLASRDDEKSFILNAKNALSASQACNFNAFSRSLESVSDLGGQFADAYTGAGGGVEMEMNVLSLAKNLRNMFDKNCVCRKR